MKSFESTPKPSSRRAFKLALAAASILPAAACGETTVETHIASADKQALASAKHPTKLEVVARNLSASEKSVTVNPNTVKVVETHAQPQEVEGDVTSLVTMVNAMNAYNREDIKVSAIGNDYGGFNKTFSKEIVDVYGIPMKMSFTTVFNGKPAVDNAITPDTIEGIGFHVTAINPEDVDTIFGYSSITIVRDGDEDWVFTASESNQVGFNHSTEEDSAATGFDNRILRTDAEFIIQTLKSNLATLDAGELYIPPVSVEPAVPEPAVIGDLPSTQ